jgi:hypothetical protein
MDNIRSVERSSIYAHVALQRLAQNKDGDIGLRRYNVEGPAVAIVGIVDHECRKVRLSKRISSKCEESRSINEVKGYGEG